MDIFSSIFLLIVIFNIYLLFFSLRYSGLTLDGDRISIENHRPHPLLSKTPELLIISNVTWYKLNQHIDTITRSFLSAVISLIICLLCLLKFSILKFSISNSSSHTGYVFLPILVSLVPVLYLLHCLLSDIVLTLKLLYSIVSIII